MPKYAVGDLVEMGSDPTYQYEIVGIGKQKYFYRNVGKNSSSGNEGALLISFFDEGNYRKVEPSFIKGKKYKTRWPGYTTFEVAEVYERGNSKVAVLWWKDDDGNEGVSAAWGWEFKEYEEVTS